ncbi:MAG: hypothetical protein AAGP08_00040 [Pseudomonadota bacterium]
MTVLTWPSELDPPLRESWRRQPVDPRQARARSAGPLGWKRRYSSTAYIVGLELELSRDQKAVLDNFFKEDTEDGTLPFSMPDPTTDGWALLDHEGRPILVQDGVPLLLSANWLCQFGEELPQESLIGVRFRAAFSLLVLP